MAGPAGLGVLVAGDVLRIDVGLGPEHGLVDAAGQERRERRVGFVPLSEQAPGLDDPGRRVAEDGPVLLLAAHAPGDEADRRVDLAEGRGADLGAEGRAEPSAQAVHGPDEPAPVGQAGDDRPALGVDEDLPVPVRLGTDPAVAFAEGADIPFPVPGVGVDGRGQPVPERPDLGVRGRDAEAPEELEEPVEHGRVEHGAPDALAAVPAADVVEGVIPVAAAEARQAVRAGVGAGEAGHGQQVLEDRPFSPVEEGLSGSEELQVAGLLEVLRHGQDEPQRVVAVPGEFPLPVAVEVMIDLAVASHLAGQEPDPGPGPGRIGDDDGDGVLGRVAEAEAAADAPVVEAGHAADVESDLGLVGDPIVQEHVGFPVGGARLGVAQEPVPFRPDGGQGRVRLGRGPVP